MTGGGAVSAGTGRRPVTARHRVAGEIDVGPTVSTASTFALSLRPAVEAYAPVEERHQFVARAIESPGGGR